MPAFTEGAFVDVHMAGPTAGAGESMTGSGGMLLRRVANFTITAFTADAAFAGHGFIRRPIGAGT